MDTYTETGAACVGINYWISLGAGVPFATLTVTVRNITLVMHKDVPILGRRYQFERESILEIRKHYDWGIFPGIKIVHSKQNYPPYILYCTFSFGSLQDHLKQFGYEVKD
jgi:hypothetical protein